MRSKIIIGALLGGSQAILGPLPGSDFPKFPTTTNPTGGNVDGDYVKEDYSKSVNGVVHGLYRAYRNALYIFPTQSI